MGVRENVGNDWEGEGGVQLDIQAGGRGDFVIPLEISSLAVLLRLGDMKNLVLFAPVREAPFFAQQRRRRKEEEEITCKQRSCACFVPSMDVELSARPARTTRRCISPRTRAQEQLSYCACDLAVGLRSMGVRRRQRLYVSMRIAFAASHLHSCCAERGAPILGFRGERVCKERAGGRVSWMGSRSHWRFIPTRTFPTRRGEIQIRT